MSSYHGWTHAPKEQGGTDPIPNLPTGAHHWAAISTETQGWEYQGAGGDDTVDWYSCWIGDDSGAYFDMDHVAGGGQNGDDIVFLTIKQSGLYTFTHQFLTADLVGPSGSHEDFYYQTRLNVCGGAPGTSWGSNTDIFPGQIGAVALLQDREQLWVANTGGDDLWLNRSWTIALRHPSPGNERRTGEIRMLHDPQGSQVFWNVRLWIIRHGDLDWAAADFDTNYTWTLGDAIP